MNHDAEAVFFHLILHTAVLEGILATAPVAWDLCEISRQHSMEFNALRNSERTAIDLDPDSDDDSTDDDVLVAYDHNPIDLAETESEFMEENNMCAAVAMRFRIRI